MTSFLGPVARIVIPGRPALLNAERSSHWRTRHAQTADVRADAHYQAVELARCGWTPPDPAVVVSWPTYSTRRSWPDVGAWFPAVKAAVDGLVDAGVWPDDDPAHVARLVFDAPRVGEVDQLTIEIHPTERDLP